MSENQRTAILVGDKNRSTIGDILIDVIIEEGESYSNTAPINPVSKKFTGHILRKGFVDSIIASWFDVRHLDGVVLTGYAEEQIVKVKAIADDVVTISSPSRVYNEVLILSIDSIPQRSHPGMKSVRIKFMEARIAGIKTREINPSDVARYAAEKKRRIGNRKGSQNSTEDENSNAFDLFDGSIPINLAKNIGAIE